MPIIEFKYTTKDGTVKKVEEIYRMNDVPPDAINVRDEDGTEYIAVRVMSLTAGKHSSWDSYEPSDLPPINT